MTLPSISYSGDKLKLFAITLVLLAVAYVLWKVTQSPNQALQFTFNGLAVGAVYALLAMGFTIVYSTVWFFDLYYGAAAALGAYGVFYLMSQYTLGGIYEVNYISINVLFAVVVAGVVAWALHTAFHHRTRSLRHRSLVRGGLVSLAGAVGVYTGFVLAYPEHMHVMLAPAVGLLTVYAVVYVLRRAYRSMFSGEASVLLVAASLAAGAALGAWFGFLLAGDARGQAVPELGSLHAVGGYGWAGAVQGAVRVHAAEGEITADNACCVSWDTAGHQRIHHHSFSEHGASASRPLRSHTVDGWGGQHQAVQRVHNRGGAGRFCGAVATVTENVLRKGCAGNRG